MRYLVLFLVVLVVSCSERPKQPTQAEITQHRSDVEAWREKRLSELKGHDGWLNLVGLFWMKEGINSFGSDAANDLVFRGKMAGKAGYFMVKSGTVSLTPVAGVDITIYGQLVTGETNVFHPDSAKAVKLHQGSIMRHGTLEWYVIRREDKLGVRLRDLESDVLANFKGIESYPVSSDWKIPAKFEPASEGKTIDITNVLGQTFPEPLAGTYVFSLGSKEYRLDATGKGKELFIVFGDATNGKDTYPAGRFIYVPRPDSLGRAFIDFNQSYNPPCAFTEFATCPLPPRQNILPVEITAGEKNYELAPSHL